MSKSNNNSKKSQAMFKPVSPQTDFPVLEHELLEKWYKNPLQNMKGSYPPYEPYFLKNVPNVMFFSGDYAIHGTYWHNKFGSRASHGCVNVPVEFSNWLYDWAPKGTRVVVF